jgi:hypothetical protein
MEWILKASLVVVKRWRDVAFSTSFEKAEDFSRGTIRRALRLHLLVGEAKDEKEEEEKKTKKRPRRSSAALIKSLAEPKKPGY